MPFFSSIWLKWNVHAKSEDGFSCLIWKTSAARNPCNKLLIRLRHQITKYIQRKKPTSEEEEKTGKTFRSSNYGQSKRRKFSGYDKTSSEDRGETNLQANWGKPAQIPRKKFFRVVILNENTSTSINIRTAEHWRFSLMAKKENFLGGFNSNSQRSRLFTRPGKVRKGSTGFFPHFLVSSYLQRLWKHINGYRAVQALSKEWLSSAREWN